jgi:hypothetical protein
MTSTKKQYGIIWHPALGVWLGDGDWSQIDHKGKDRAPVFEASTNLKEVFGDFPIDHDMVSRSKWVEVLNTNGDGTASREHIHDDGIDGWDPKVPVERKLSFE